MVNPTECSVVLPAASVADTVSVCSPSARVCNGTVVPDSIGSPSRVADRSATPESSSRTCHVGVRSVASP